MGCSLICTEPANGVIDSQATTSVRTGRPTRTTAQDERDRPRRGRCPSPTYSSGCVGTLSAWPTWPTATTSLNSPSAYGRDELIALLDAHAPRLDRALKKVAKRSGEVVLIDGTVIPTPRRSRRADRRNYSGQHHHHGLHFLALTDENDA